MAEDIPAEDRLQILDWSQNEKTFAITVLCLFLAACTGGKSDEVGVQTRVAQLLTSFPTPSTMPTIITTIPQPVTPTPEFTATLAELTATDTLMPIATETLVVSVSTATSEPTTGGTPASTPTVTATIYCWRSAFGIGKSYLERYNGCQPQLADRNR